MGTAVTLYSGENLDGRSLVVRTGENYEHLDNVDFNDDVKSMEVAQGYYSVVYKHAGFGGDKRVYETGNYYKKCWGFGMSSIKTYTTCAAIVYKEKGFTGDSVIIDNDMSNFSKDGFIDKEISSMKIMPGCTLTFFTDIHFEGDYKTYTNSDQTILEISDLSKEDKDWHDKFRSVQVTYNFGIQTYSDIEFKGDTQQFGTGEFNSTLYENPLKPIKSIKVNPRYTVEIFESGNWTGTSTIYKGPCTITNLGYTGNSIQVYNNHYIFSCYSQNDFKGDCMLFPTSVHDLSEYKLGDSYWSEKVSSIKISAGYIAQLCKGADYSKDNKIIIAEKEDVYIDFASGTEWESWKNSIVSMRAFDINLPAAYLFKSGDYKDEHVKCINLGNSKYPCWCWNCDDGRKHCIEDRELSAVLITGNLKVTLNSTYPGCKPFNLYGPGLFDLSAEYHNAGGISVYDDYTDDIDISTYTPNNYLAGNVRGYDNLKLFRGELHCHTYWSDAYWGGLIGTYIEDPHNNFNIYQDYGYDFCGISDHTFGIWGYENTAFYGYCRYTGNDGKDSDCGHDYSLSKDDWEKTKKDSDDSKHSYNFSALAGYEYSLGGIAMNEYEHENVPDAIAHFNVFGVDKGEKKEIYYGENGRWVNNPTGRKDFYKWASGEYNTNKCLVVQFNHPSSGGKGFNYFKTDEVANCSMEPFKLIEVFSVSYDNKDKEWVECYKSALAFGWKVAPTATSDNHDGADLIGTNYTRIRTVVVADKNSKDSILDALVARRVYATRIPNLNIGFSLTNNRNETSIMGEDINRYGDMLYLDLSVSKLSDWDDNIMQVKLYGYTIKQDYSYDEKYITLSQNTVSNYPISSDWLNGVNYVFVEITSTKYNENNGNGEMTCAAVTAPIWIVG